MSPMTVWVIETGEYEDGYVFGVAESLDAAVAYVRAQFGPPYQVSWSEIQNNPGPSIVGTFQQVPNYSTTHSVRFYFSEHPVERL